MEGSQAGRSPALPRVVLGWSVRSLPRPVHPDLAGTGGGTPLTISRPSWCLWLVSLVSTLFSSLFGRHKASDGEVSHQSPEQQRSFVTKPQPSRRVLVLGCTLPKPVESFLWTEVPNTISIADYETVILDLTPFGAPGTREFADAYLPEGRKFNQLFLRSNSELIVIGRPDVTFSRSRTGMGAFQYASFWMPRYFPSIETGQQGKGGINIVSSEFRSYLDQVIEWSYYWNFYIDPQSRPPYQAFMQIDLFGNFDWGEFRVKPVLSALAQTRFGAPIAFKMRYDYLSKDTGEPIGCSGYLYCLPPPAKISTADAIRRILLERYDFVFEKEAPSWVSGYTLPNMEAVKEGIAEIESQIAELVSKRDLARVQYDKESRFLGLLYGQGDDFLEPLVRDALRELGAKVIDPVRRGEEDGRIIDPWDRKAVLEIKGRGKQIPLTDVRQLQDWVADSVNDGWTKGILIANAFRDQPPANRKNVYASNALENAARDSLALVTTTQLFLALHRKQAGELDLKVFWDILMTTAGPCKLPELP